MKDSSRTKQELIEEISILKKKNKKLEKTETAYKQAAAALWESEANYKQLFDNSPAGIYQINFRTGKFLKANDLICEYLGCSQEEITSLSPYDFITKESQNVFLERLNKMATGDKVPEDPDYEFVDKKGKHRWLKLNSKNIYDSEGLAGADVVVHDITERKQMEEALRQSEEKYRSIIENIQDGYFEVDLDGCFTFSNDSLCEIHGYSKEELLGMNHRQYADKENAKKVFEVFNKIYKTGITASIFDYEIIRKDGTRRQIELSASLIKDSAGKPIGFRGTTRDATEHKKMAETIRQSEERYRTILDEMADAYFEVDIAGKFTFVNDAVCRHLGYSREELIGANFRGQMVKEESDIVYKAFNNIYKTGKPEKAILYKFLRKAGTTGFAEVAGFPLQNQKGKIIGFRGVSRDITERKQVEQIILHNENRFKTLYQENPISTFTWQKKGDDFFLVDFNRASILLTEGKASKFMGKSAQELYQKRPEIIDDMLRCFKDQSLISRELVSQDFAPGKILSVSYSYIHPDLIILRAEDITEHKRADEALRQSEEKYRTILENIQEGYFEVDLAGNLTFLNDSLCQIFGYPKDEFMGMNNRQYTDKENAKKLFLTFNEVFKTGKPAKAFDWQIIRKDGTTRFIEASISLKIDSSGKPIGFQGLTRDITERKQAEVEKAKLETQLQQSQKMESVGRLAGGVAHDFNNMLGVILGHTELALMKMVPGQPLYNNLTEIRKAAERSAELTRQLLAFARKQTVVPKVLDMNETVSGMLKMLKRLIGEDIDLNWQPKENLWPVKVDPSQIDQILANLCVNARDAIAGVGKMTIETRNITIDKGFCAAHAGFIPGEYVLIAVSDNGCGMDKETLSHLFEPFFTTKGIGQGTGLGLATVYGAVKQNNGFINVYSEPGKGTTFNIYLPRHKGKSGQTLTEAPEVPAARGHETILLVEDEPAILEMTTTMLEMKGYKVLAAGTPGEAIRLAREHAGEIHLLMTDVVMPEMNGRDLAKNLLSLYPQLKRLFMSGYTANVIAHHGVLDEGVYFIQKPFSISELTAKVREALEEKANHFSR